MSYVEAALWLTAFYVALLPACLVAGAATEYGVWLARWYLFGEKREPEPCQNQSSLPVGGITSKPVSDVELPLVSDRTSPVSF